MDLWLCTSIPPIYIYVQTLFSFSITPWMHYALLVLSLLVEYILSFNLKAFLIRFVFIGGFIGVNCWIILPSSIFKNLNSVFSGNFLAFILYLSTISLSRNAALNAGFAQVWQNQLLLMRWLNSFINSLSRLQQWLEK